MLFERLESAGLAHYSYLIGDRDQAVVIDPRRDVDAYLERAGRAGMRLSHVLETHRNEDYVVGSRELAARSGAEILHSCHGGETYGYGSPIHDGATLAIGRLRLEAMHTPGHTLGHLAYLLYDPSGAPWIVFTGDALFAGDVGRVDLLGGERMEEMAGLLYDSLFRRILPLGLEVIVCPAHGAGSACGASIAERTWTTIGLERKLNPRLQYATRERFVAEVAQALEYPPYFQRMEEVNREGPAVLGAWPSPPPLAANEFAARAADAQVLDTRGDVAFGGAHVPGALSIWEEGVPHFAGWFLSYERPILLVTASNDVSRAVRYLIRLGYDRLEGYLADGMLGWHMAGLESRRNGLITVQELCCRLDRGEETWILDVRSGGELEQEGRIPGAHHIHITHLPGRIDEVPADRPLFIFCGSGLRSTIAASLLQRAGRQDVTVVLGGFAGWKSARFPLQKARHVP